mmetsp:Transcript_16698/g.53313  ORF Transcript_16698/g.53313 Transcript_16698/m.53313 type:complete len:921 (-) Transcript_16698:8-2770(-)
MDGAEATLHLAKQQQSLLQKLHLLQQRWAVEKEALTQERDKYAAEAQRLGMENLDLKYRLERTAEQAEEATRARDELEASIATLRQENEQMVRILHSTSQREKEALMSSLRPDTADKVGFQPSHASLHGSMLLRDSLGSEEFEAASEVVSVARSDAWHHYGRRYHPERHGLAHGHNAQRRGSPRRAGRHVYGLSRRERYDHRERAARRGRDHGRHHVGGHRRPARQGSPSSSDSDGNLSDSYSDSHGHSVGTSDHRSGRDHARRHGKGARQSGSSGYRTASEDSASTQVLSSAASSSSSSSGSDSGSDSDSSGSRPRSRRGGSTHGRQPRESGAPPNGSHSSSSSSSEAQRHHHHRRGDVDSMEQTESEFEDALDAAPSASLFAVAAPSVQRVARASAAAAPTPASSVPASASDEALPASSSSSSGGSPRPGGDDALRKDVEGTLEALSALLLERGVASDESEQLLQQLDLATVKWCHRVRDLGQQLACTAAQLKEALGKWSHQRLCWRKDAEMLRRVQADRRRLRHDRSALRRRLRDLSDKHQRWRKAVQTALGAVREQARAEREGWLRERAALIARLGGYGAYPSGPYPGGADGVAREGDPTQGALAARYLPNGAASGGGVPSGARIPPSARLVAGTTMPPPSGAIAALLGPAAAEASLLQWQQTQDAQGPAATATAAAATPAAASEAAKSPHTQLRRGSNRHIRRPGIVSAASVVAARAQKLSAEGANGTLPSPPAAAQSPSAAAAGVAPGQQPSSAQSERPPSEALTPTPTPIASIVPRIRPAAGVEAAPATAAPARAPAPAPAPAPATSHAQSSPLAPVSRQSTPRATSGPPATRAGGALASTAPAPVPAPPRATQAPLLSPAPAPAQVPKQPSTSARTSDPRPTVPSPHVASSASASSATSQQTASTVSSHASS